MDHEKERHLPLINHQSKLSDAIRAELILLVFLLLFGVLILFACRKEAPKDGGTASEKTRFTEGTFVLGADIGGLTREEAERSLKEKAESGCKSYRCRLGLGEREFILTADQLDVETDLASVLDRAMLSGAGEYPVRAFPADNEKLDAAVRALAKEVNASAKPARLTLIEEGGSSPAGERFAVTKAEAGVRLDEAGLKQLLRAGETELALPVFSIAPSGAEPKLPVMMASFATSFASERLCGANRVFNIKKAAALLNGRSLAPGERLSCNAVLGERTEEAGWKTAAAFANGGSETEQQYGGGICQVSTTLYNCALLSGLQVPERCSHSRRVSYVEGGLDAALSWPDADLVILNSTSETIYIFMWADESRMELCCEIWGGGFRGSYNGIRLMSELVSKQEPGEAEFETDPSLSAGECILRRSAITGSTYRTWRIFLKDDLDLWREEIAQTVYPMHPALYAVGSAENGVDGTS